MEGEFKQCPNGHYYQGASCPYCKSGSGNTGSNTSLKTEVFVSKNGENTHETQGYGSDNTKTTAVGKQETVANQGRGNAVPPPNRTVFEETKTKETPCGTVIETKTSRSCRKLVGWLVTYSHDTMGVDYKLKEGRNSVGHDVDCNIYVNDPMMSGKHATILFQDNTYFLKDEFSTHGTFVNNEKMRPDSSQEIKDGDIIRLGKTEFKFRTSL